VVDGSEGVADVQLIRGFRRRRRGRGQHTESQNPSREMTISSEPAEHLNKRRLPADIRAGIRKLPEVLERVEAARLRVAFSLAGPRDNSALMAKLGARLNSSLQHQGECC